MKLIIASKNTHKVREIGQMLESSDFEVSSLLEYPDYISPEETGQTFIDNARLKAKALFNYLKNNTRTPNTEHRTPIFVLADDSGLSCKALNGAPGVQSARFAGENATDEQNNQKLINTFNSNPDLDRSAHYTCAMILLLPDGTEKVIEEYCHGHIQTKAIGENGFGYDPYFYLKDYNQTMAQISPQEKNRISHRGKALKKLLEILNSDRY